MLGSLTKSEKSDVVILPVKESGSGAWLTSKLSPALSEPKLDRVYIDLGASAINALLPLLFASDSPEPVLDSWLALSRLSHIATLVVSETKVVARENNKRILILDTENCDWFFDIASVLIPFFDFFLFSNLI